MITLYGMGSPNVLKVLIALEELGLPYRFEYIDVFHGEQFSDTFGRITPNRKVPVIIDEDGPDGQPLTLWESGAILIHLAEKAGQLLPTEPRARLIALQWLMFQMAGIGPMFGQNSHFRIFSPESEHAYARARYATEVKRLFDVVELRLAESAFLGGPDYGIVDIASWPWLRSAKARNVDLDTLPATKRWVEALGARPAVQRATSFFENLKAPDVPRMLKEESDSLDRYLGRGKYSRADA